MQYRIVGDIGVLCLALILDYEFSKFRHNRCLGRSRKYVCHYVHFENY